MNLPPSRRPWYEALRRKAEEASVQSSQSPLAGCLCEENTMPTYTGPCTTSITKERRKEQMFGFTKIGQFTRGHAPDHVD